ncbi:MAG: 2-C-methyl-D-erythritol 4-phosphate cytidylyltransferase [Leptospiraceae bacterium]|nr:2-C-methyl-D-erythritol 4-phosphate cytidylyltransferase [Leptospiraceae bacterium]MCP5500769.1 2-C-methyl-D-erythritol 4-phosphate cytidylyltransferase [Leptospiraceae bacterium]
MNQFYAILLSGGTGSRLDSETPKQFLKIKGKSLLQRSVLLFKVWGLAKRLTIVSHPDFIEETELDLKELLDEGDQIVTGGKSRHESSLNAFKNIPYDESDILIIHDVARPFVKPYELDMICNAAIQHGLSSLAFPLHETLVLKNIEDKAETLIKREDAMLIKTPQAIHAQRLKHLLYLDPKEEPTDLSSWGIQGGLTTKLVESNPYNIKITRKEDLLLAEFYYEPFKNFKAQ